MFTVIFMKMNKIMVLQLKKKKTLSQSSAMLKLDLALDTQPPPPVAPNNPSYCFSLPFWNRASKEKLTSLNFFFFFFLFLNFT